MPPKPKTPPVEEPKPVEVREPFFETTIHHAAVVLTKRDAEVAVGMDELAASVVKQQTAYHTSVADKLKAYNDARSEREAAIEAGTAAKNLPPVPKLEKEDPPSIFTRVSFCVADFDQARRTAVGKAELPDDVMGKAGQKIKDAFEACTDPEKGVEPAEWAGVPTELKSVLLNACVDAECARVLRVEEDRRLDLISAAEAKIKETAKKKEEAEANIAAAQAALEAAQIPEGTKKADITPEMKQALKDATKAVTKAKEVLPKLLADNAVRTTARDHELELKGEPYTINLVMFMKGFGTSAAEFAAMNEAGASIQALAWVQALYPEGVEPPAPPPPAEGEEAPDPTADPALVMELAELTAAADTWLAGCRQMALVDVSFDVPAAAGAASAAAGAASAATTPLGAAAAAVLATADTLVAQVRSYRKWRQEVHTIEVPAASGDAVDLEVYTKMLDGVNNEKLTVPVLLHCLVEQVAFSLLDPEEMVQSAQLDAESAALYHMEALFADLLTTPELADTKPTAPTAPTAPTRELPLLHEGDDVNHTTVFNSAAVYAQIDPADIEARMLKMLRLPGVGRLHMPAEPELDSEGVGQRKTSMAAFCTGDTTLVQLQRFHILRELVSMLPPNAQKAHAAEILSRRHLESLPLASFAQIFTHACENFPEVYTKYLALEDCLLVALAASEPMYEVHLAIPRALSFHDYWAQFVAEAGEGLSLPLEVYALEADAAAVHWSARLFSASDGALAHLRGPQDCTVVNQTLRLGLRALTPNLPMVVPPEVPLTPMEAAAAAMEAEPAAETAEPVPSAAGSRSMVQATYNGAVVSVTVEDEVTRLQVMTKSGMVTEINSNGSVLQGHSLRMKDRPFRKPVGGAMSDISGAESATVEVFRCTTLDGVVCRNLANGDVQVLLPDGNITQREVRERRWVAVNNAGVRWTQGDPYIPKPDTPPAPQSPLDGEEPASRPGTAPEGAAEGEAEPEPEPEPVGPVTPAPKPLEPLAITSVEDPDTHAKVTARQDLMMFIDYPNGDYSVLFADGTRLSRLPADGIVWQIECEGLAPIQRHGSVITVDVGQGVLSYNADDGTMKLEGGDCGVLLVRAGGQVVHAPARLPSPAQAAGAAMAAATEALRQYNEMAAEYEAWTAAQNEYRAAYDAYMTAQDKYKTELAEFEANPPAAAEGEEAPSPPSPPPVPTAPETPEGLCDPAKLYPPMGTELQGCYLLDVNMHLVATCDEAGDGFHLPASGAAVDFGPGRVAEQQARADHEQWVADWHRAKEEAAAAALAAAEEAAAAEAAAAAAAAEAEAQRIADEKALEDALALAAKGNPGGRGPDAKPKEAAPAPEAPAEVADGAAAPAEGEEASADGAAAEEGDAAEAAPSNAEGTEAAEESPGEFVFPFCASYQPRLFMVYSDGKAVEILDKASYELYLQQRSLEPQCTLAAATVHGQEGEEGVTALTFLTELTQRAIGAVDPLNIAPRVAPRPASALRTMPSLKAPSRLTPLPPQPALTIPRVVAMPPQPAPPKPQNALVYRQVLEYPNFPADTLDVLEESLGRYEAWQETTDNTSAESYRVPDARTEEEHAQEASVADAILRARGAMQKEVQARIKREELAALEAELDQNPPPPSEEASLPEEALKAPPKKYTNPAGELGARPPVSFFAVEEGVAALKTIADKPTRKLPPRPAEAVPTRPMKPLPPVTPVNSAPTGGGGGGGGFVPGMSLNSYTQSAAFQQTETTGIPTMEAGDMGDEVHAYDGYSYGDEMQTYYATMSPETEAKIHARREARALDVTGKPRKALVDNIPGRYRASEAEPHPNWRYHEIEEEARRALRTSSTEKLKNRGMRKQFTLSPAHIHFGRVTLGETVRKVCTLSNVSPDIGHFFIRPVAAPLAIDYTPGMLAAGMGTQLSVSFTPTEVGDFCDEIYVNTEFHHFVLTVSAKVASANGELASAKAGGPHAVLENDENQAESNAAAEADTAVPKMHACGVVADIELDENATLDELKERVEGGGEGEGDQQ